MKKRFPLTKRRADERGYALMMAVFLMTVMLIATITAAMSVRTERQREKEEEMIWRGKQYVRAIKLYYRKNGKFPTNLDDLIKPKNGSLPPAGVQGSDEQGRRNLEADLRWAGGAAYRQLKTSAEAAAARATRRGGGRRAGDAGAVGVREQQLR